MTEAIGSTAASEKRARSGYTRLEMAKVQLRDVRKSYIADEVIHGVSIDVADGEFIVIVGPSGWGKSPLLRRVAGLEAIAAGEIVIGDRVVNTLEPKDRDIAMVFQNYALYPHMSVYDNMAYGLKIRGLAKPDIEARVKRAAGILELAPLLERKPRQLSGGQRQRPPRSAATLQFFCSTSRCRIWTRSFAFKCASRSRSFTAAWERPACT